MRENASSDHVHGLPGTRGLGADVGAQRGPEAVPQAARGAGRDRVEEAAGKPLGSASGAQSRVIEGQRRSKQFYGQITLQGKSLPCPAI